ncbi:hypothetical protein HWV62_31776 [Athelia sp. TMB]|nr:hypothetical protein HWV62_31776 [Athelia sp. TMB]
MSTLSCLCILPPELLQLIIQHLSQADLYHLCALSRNIYEEVVLALYRDVELSRTNFKQLLTWANQMVGPNNIGQKTCSLSLPSQVNLIAGLGNDDDLMEQLSDLLPRAMKSLVNLKVLAIVPPVAYSSLLKVYHISSADLLDCGFHLHTFSYNWDGVRWAGSLFRFLAEQSNICNLAIGEMVDSDEDAPDVLPRLSVATVIYRAGVLSRILKTIAARYLRRLRLEIIVSRSNDHITAALHYLATVNATLTHLYIGSEYVPFTAEVDHAGTLKTIGSCFPNLTFLRYLNIRILDRESFPRALSAFKLLEILQLAVDTSGRQKPIDASQTHACGLVERCMTTCPTLHLVAVTVVGRRFKGGEQPRDYTAFSRTSGSTFQLGFEKSRPIGDDAWREVM